MGEQKHVLVLQNYICIKYGSLLFKKEKNILFPKPGPLIQF